MKKIIAMLLAVMMVLAMVACAAKQAETTTEARVSALASNVSGSANEPFISFSTTHIAGLPVAVNINCHVARHRTEVL